MQNEILLAVVQAATEFLPVSSSGHLALLSNIISEPDLFLITILHVASLFAVLIFVRKEIYELLTFKKQYRKLWLYLIIATIPAALVGFFLNKLIEETFSSFLVLSLAFFFTGFILLLTRIKTPASKLNYKNALIIGLFQAIALFPGISRSGMTISSAMFAGIEKEKAAKFSFLLFIPIVIGAMILEAGQAYFSLTLAVAFVISFLLSLIFLNILVYVLKKGYFWMFSVYCFILGIISLILYLFY